MFVQAGCGHVSSHIYSRHLLLLRRTLYPVPYVYSDHSTLYYVLALWSKYTRIISSLMLFSLHFCFVNHVQLDAHQDRVRVLSTSRKGIEWRFPLASHCVARSLNFEVCVKSVGKLLCLWSLLNYSKTPAKVRAPLKRLVPGLPGQQSTRLGTVRC